MRLKDRNQAPAGGWWFKTDDGTVIRPKRNPGLNQLHDDVLDYLLTKGLPVPDRLIELIEDQVCTRQPKGRCKYQGLGDRVAQVIHTAAAVVDSVAGTNYEYKARGCGGCGARRRRLNGLKS
jgi:hypothetical protein